MSRRFIVLDDLSPNVGPLIAPAGPDEPPVILSEAELAAMTASEDVETAIAILTAVGAIRLLDEEPPAPEPFAARKAPKPAPDAAPTPTEEAA